VTRWYMDALAGVYGHQGKYAQAQALFRESLKAKPDSPEILNDLAWYLVSPPDPRQRRPQEALQLARRAVKGAPEAAAYYNSLGLAEYRNGLWDEAVATLHKSAEMSKGSEPLDFLFLAMAHWARGDKAEAEQYFKRGVDGASKREANNWELRMFWAEAAERLGKPGPPGRDFPSSR